MMTDLAFYIRAVKNNTAVVCLEQRQEKDLLAEVESHYSLWRHDSGVTLRCIRENELVAETENVCPECWILWEIVDACGQTIRPLKKQFHNACQEAFWLQRQHAE